MLSKYIILIFDKYVFCIIYYACMYVYIYTYTHIIYYVIYCISHTCICICSTLYPIHGCFPWDNRIAAH